MKLFLVRHALPGAVKYDNRYPGPGLGETGRQQAHWIGEALSSSPLSLLLSSDFTRTCETSEIILSYHPKLQQITDPRLRERQAEEETHESLVRRINSFMEEFAEAFQAQCTCIVAHGGSLNMILNYLDPEEIHFDYPYRNQYQVKTPIAGIWEINPTLKSAELVQCPV